MIMVKSPRRVRARNPFLYPLIAVVALAVIAAGGFIWYRQQQDIAQTSVAATSAAVQATSQGQTAVVQAAQSAITATAAAALAEIERHYQAALAFQTAGDYEQARAGFQAVIRLNPGYKDSAARLKQAGDALADGYYQQAVAAAEQKLWPDAVANFDKVLAIVPNYKDTATRRAAAAKALNATATPKPATQTPTLQPSATSVAETTTIKPTSAVVTSTAVTSATNPPDAAAIPTPADANPTPKALATGKPSGDWAVRSYNTDDTGVVFVNGQLVAASLWGDRTDSGWIKINDYLATDQENEIVVASWNSAYDRSWGFGVRRNDTQVWGSEEPARREQVGLSYVQRLRITSDGAVEPVPADTAAPKPPPGKWYARVQGAQDLGAVLVNGIPTVLNASAFAAESGWIEITGQLTSSRNNTVTMVAWNFDGPYSYKFEIKHDATIVWGADKTGGGQIGVVLSQPVQISAKGEVKQ
jgi:tetratricopeptide (TPR) repeat protein